MQLSDFHFDLPDELIANHPPARRTDSRLLCMNRSSGALDHRHFYELPALINPEDLLVFNNTRVIPARIFGMKPSGGKIEVLLERLMPQNRVLAQIRSSKSPKAGSIIFLGDETLGLTEVAVLGREGEFFILEFAPDLDLIALLNRVGHMPLPPYIKREDVVADRERYQTVYAANPGAVAAPTAGLHFDEQLLTQIREKGARSAQVTLHVGAGTFQPVRVDNIMEHEMHAEWLQVDESVCQAVRDCRARGGRVIAVGTTSVRALETASQSGEIAPFSGDTRIFIYPGYTFKSVDALITNFHLPESTLLMLVSAFSSREHVMQAYAKAVAEQYRFFSYGDAMFMY